MRNMNDLKVLFGDQETMKEIELPPIAIVHIRKYLHLTRFNTPGT